MNKHEKHKDEKKEIKIKDNSEEQMSESAPVQQEADEINKLKMEVETYRDTLLRKAAEFENYKKRTEGEVSNY